MNQMALNFTQPDPPNRGKFNGSDDPSNFVPACTPCNSSKGARTPEEWRA